MKPEALAKVTRAAELAKERWNARSLAAAAAAKPPSRVNFLTQQGISGADELDA